MAEKKSTPAQLAARKKYLALLGGTNKGARLTASRARRVALDALVIGS